MSWLKRLSANNLAPMLLLPLLSCTPEYVFFVVSSLSPLKRKGALRSNSARAMGHDFTFPVKAPRTLSGSLPRGKS